MRVWIDLANSPHVPLFVPVVDHLRDAGHDVVLTARLHAQTVELATTAWGQFEIVGGESPGGRVRKGAAIVGRAEALRRFARRSRPDAALSHGSYAQIVAARAARVPAVTMMDYEHQPANHLSFRLAQRVIVPSVFPAAALRRFGAAERRVIRYDGFKEELYLADRQIDDHVAGELGLDAGAVTVVMRPPPRGALYHGGGADRFDELLDVAARSAGVQVVLLPRTRDQQLAYAGVDGVIVPATAVDGASLLASADLVIGGGGTMNREAALLGIPTYTVFTGELGAVDAELIRSGRMADLRDTASVPAFVKRTRPPSPPGRERQRVVMDAIDRALAATATRRAA